MTNSKIKIDSKTKKSATIINFPKTILNTVLTQSEKSIVDFTVFGKCLYSDRNDWKGRAFDVLREVYLCLFWEELLQHRKMFDQGHIGCFSYRYEAKIAENTQEHCRMKFEFHPMKVAKHVRSMPNWATASGNASLPVRSSVPNRTDHITTVRSILSSWSTTLRTCMRITRAAPLFAQSDGILNCKNITKKHNGTPRKSKQVPPI